MHRIVTIDITTENKRKVIPYLHEHVNFLNSMGQIRDLLRKYDCEQIVSAEKDVHDTKHGNFVVYTLAFIIKGKKFVVEFPVIFATSRKGNIPRMDISGRLMFHKIKSILADVEIGYLSFSEAMMQFQIVTLPNGSQATLMDYVREHEQELSAGTADLLQLPGR